MWDIVGNSEDAFSQVMTHLNSTTNLSGMVASLISLSSPGVLIYGTNVPQLADSEGQFDNYVEFFGGTFTSGNRNILKEFWGKSLSHIF